MKRQITSVVPKALVAYRLRPAGQAEEKPKQSYLEKPKKNYGKSESQTLFYHPTL